ncbi:hypothetical protein G6O69_02990 [Pseudenhygromyxa sp. WMMC2535]|uniref:hypothetical protein n=1 Tax=Pseudenhygromyxa sp. WMMC2535 TaxID=2712867 RepID=UPI001552EDAD|nr:hypothetical protein [Pseudenhygromyxa sp. WMMC2535]NVB36783.1 hypothetical protein [Pseudenhygromyxa sp. WMMC2535]
MRALGKLHRPFLRTLSVLALSAGLCASSGCARRLELTPSEFERIEKREQAVEALRVYVSKKLVVIYEEEDDAESYAVNKNVTESSEERRLKVITAKSTRGLIIDTDSKNGAPLLWVTFTSSCKDISCAYGFVQTEDGVFRLAVIPPREGYKQPKAYYAREKKPLDLGKLKSLAEKNDVYVWKNWREKVFTVDLIIKKRTDKKRDTNVIRDEGIH